MARHISWESPNRQVADINGPAHHNIVEITAALEAAADNGLVTVPRPWTLWAERLMLQLHDAGLHIDAIRGYIQMYDDCKLRRAALLNAMVRVFAWFPTGRWRMTELWDDVHMSNGMRIAPRVVPEEYAMPVDMAIAFAMGTNVSLKKDKSFSWLSLVHRDILQRVLAIAASMPTVQCGQDNVSPLFVALSEQDLRADVQHTATKTLNGLVVSGAFRYATDSRWLNKGGRTQEFNEAIPSELHPNYLDWSFMCDLSPDVLIETSCDDIDYVAHLVWNNTRNAILSKTQNSYWIVVRVFYYLQDAYEGGMFIDDDDTTKRTLVNLSCTPNIIRSSSEMLDLIVSEDFYKSRMPDESGSYMKYSYRRMVQVDMDTTIGDVYRAVANKEGWGTCLKSYEQFFGRQDPTGDQLGDNANGDQLVSSYLIAQIPDFKGAEEVNTVVSSEIPNSQRQARISGINFASDMVLNFHWPQEAYSFCSR